MYPMCPAEHGWPPIGGDETSAEISSDALPTTAANIRGPFRRGCAGPLYSLPFAAIRQPVETSRWAGK